MILSGNKTGEKLVTKAVIVSELNFLDKQDNLVYHQTLIYEIADFSNITAAPLKLLHKDGTQS